MKKIIIINCAALFALGICELSAFDYSSGSAAETAAEVEDGGWLFDSSKTETNPVVAKQATKPTVKTSVASNSKTVAASSDEAEGSSWFFDSDKNESIAASDKKEFRETADTSEYEKTGKEALEGWFAGIGLTQVASNSKATAIEHTYEWSGDVDYGIVGAPDEQMLAGELYPYGIAGDIHLGTTGNHLAWFNVNRADNLTLAQGKLSKLGGSLTFGYGQFIMGDAYFGGQFTVDFSSNKEREETPGKGLGAVKLQSNGIKPSLAVVLGMYSSVIDSLIYARLGACYSKTELKSSNGNVKLSKLSPLIGLGVKKNIGHNLSMGCEFDYIFETDKKGNLTRTIPVALNAAAVPNTAVTHTARVQTKQRGYAVRVLMMYNF